MTPGKGEPSGPPVIHAEVAEGTLMTMEFLAEIKTLEETVFTAEMDCYSSGS